MASTADTTSYRFTASDMVSDVTEALQAWRNASHEEQASLWRKYNEARRKVVDLVVDGMRYRDA